MPSYDYQCRFCGDTQTKINKISERKTNAPVCCETKMKTAIFTAPSVAGTTAREFIAQPCPATGEIITSNRQLKNIRAKHGLMDSRDLGDKGRAKRYVDSRQKIKAKRDKQRVDYEKEHNVKFVGA